MTRTRPLVSLITLCVAMAATLPARDAQDSPQAAVDALLAADRAFAAAAASRDVVDALAPMFTDDVMMPQPPATFARGKQDVMAAIAANPDNRGGRLTWAPGRGGISGDGTQGFTFGYMTLTRTDATKVPIKYLSYWIKDTAGWRVAVYKRARSAEGAAPATLMAPALPLRLLAPSTDPQVTARHRDSLARAEQAFSDEAQRIGLGPAFRKYGSDDAVNMGGPQTAAFVVGADAIARAVGAGAPGPGSPVTWASNVAVLVASSGDLGASLGMIRQHQPAAGAPPAVPFITIWRRPSPTAEWRYVAE